MAKGDTLLPGEIFRSKSRATGTVCVMIDRAQVPDSGYTKEGKGRWQAQCLDHDQAALYDTRRQGFKDFSAVAWCPECQAEPAAAPEEPVAADAVPV
jgi:hypothetical protein